jgi:large subunit ribosomal protein L35
MGKKNMKTHQATAKRFRKTGSGKILRTKGHHGHFRRRKSSRSINEMKKCTKSKPPV